MDFLVLPSQIVFLLVFTIIVVREKYTIGKENLIICPESCIYSQPYQRTLIQLLKTVPYS